MSALNPEEKRCGQYLTFTLRDEDFAIDIAKVREVLDVATMTKIPLAPAYLSGVINLRGNVVPVLDLGCRLGMEPVVRTKNTCVMIVETTIEEATVAMGTVADAVQAVLDLPASEIEEVPRLGTRINTEFISGMGKQGEKFLSILNIDKILAHAGEDLRLSLAPDQLPDSAPAAAAAEEDASAAP